jgi:hypothetical protein
LGDYKKNKKYWDKNSSVQLLKSFKGARTNLKMFVTCGDKDFAYKANSMFWSAAANLKIPMISVKDKGGSQLGILDFTYRFSNVVF